MSATIPTTPRNTATAYRLGAHGTIVRITAGAPDASATTPTAATATIAVVDRSGSMNITVPPIIREIIPNALVELGLPDTALVELIAFESVTVHQSLTISAMRGSQLACAGGTNMAEAAMLTAAMLASSPQTPYRIIVISDGQISDIDRTLQSAARFEAMLAEAGRSAPVTVCIIRALTSNTADPDTRALACFGQLNSSGVTVPVDCPIIPQMRTTTQIVLHRLVSESFISEESKKVMQRAVTDCLRADGGVAKLATVTCGGAAVLTRLPGALAQDSLMMPLGESFIILAEAADLSQFTVNGELVQVTEAKLGSEDDVKPLLLYLESHARQLMVIGKDLQRVKMLVDWVGAVSSALQVDVVTVGPDLVSRRNAILRDMSQTQRSVVMRIHSLASVERVDTLNSQRQADFLRGVGHGSLGRALARRATKADGIDIEAAARIEVQQLCDSIRDKPLPEVKDEPNSFYSAASFTYCCNELAHVKEADLADMSVGQLMRLVGPIGYTFRARGGDAPDPWSCFQVEQVYIGDTGVLLSCDLWEARTQGGANPTIVLKDPATEKAITGVAPVERMARAPFAAMRRWAPTLFNLHVSASLRNSLVPMPGDYHAMTAAVAVRLCVQLAEEKEPSAATARALLDVGHTLAQMHARLQLLPKDMLQGFARQDPRPYLAGDLFVASGLKPLAAVLAGTSVRCSVALAKAIVGHSMYLAAGRAYREPAERTAALHQMLGIDAARDTSVGAPGTPDPIRPVFCTDYPADWSCAAWLSSRALQGSQCAQGMHGPLSSECGPHTVRAVWLACRPLWILSRAERWDDTAAFLKSYKDAIELAQTAPIFGDISHSNLMQVLAVQAIKSPSLEARIKIEERVPSPPAATYVQVASAASVPVAGQRVRLSTVNPFDTLVAEEVKEEPPTRTYRFPDICTDAEAKTYIGSVVAEIYEERYKKALKAKRIAEEGERCRAAIEAMVNSPKASEFIALLTGPASIPAEATADEAKSARPIADRSSPGYAPLVTALCDLTRDVPKRLGKLWILITGRDNKMKPVWCAGNFLRGNLAPFEKVFADSKEDPDGKIWRALTQTRSRFGIHRYNRAGPNRHGHGNDNPSWWAMGYDSPAAYQATDPAAFAEYVGRRRTGGRRIPSWMRDLKKQ